MGMDFNKLMKQAAQMQEQLAQAQEEAATQVVEASAGGGMVTVKATGSGEEKTIQKVTWSGGSVPTDEDSVFRFNGSLDSSKTYTFKVRQTYSNGKIVDWTGSESSDTPAPVVDGVSDLGGGSSSTLTIVALVVGAIGVLLGILGLATRGRPLA